MLADRQKDKQGLTANEPYDHEAYDESCAGCAGVAEGGEDGAPAVGVLLQPDGHHQTH